jgi:hypothetical protein
MPRGIVEVERGIVEVDRSPEESRRLSAGCSNLRRCAIDPTLEVEARRSDRIGLPVTSDEHEAMFIYASLLWVREILPRRLHR